MKNLIINSSLAITDANMGLIAIVAKKKGWVPSDDATNTPQKFLAENVIAPHINNFIAEAVLDAFTWYYGDSQSATAGAVFNLVKTNIVTGVTFEEA